MTKKLFRSIFLSCLLIAGVSVVLVISILSNHYRSQEENQLKQEATLAARGIETDGASFFDSMSLDSYRVTWIDADGTVQYDSRNDFSSMTNHSDREEFYEALQNGTGMSDRYSSTMSTRTVYYAIRIADGSVVRTSIEQDTLLLVVPKMLSPILLIGIAAMAVGWFLAHSLSRSIVAPLNQLDLDHPLANQVDEEIFPLLKKIDEQNTKIDAQVEQLHARKKEFDTITDVMTEGLILMDRNGFVLSINQAARLLFGAEENQSEGKSILTLDRSQTMSQALETVLHGKSDLEVLHRNNRIYQIHTSPVFSHGNQIGACMVLFDITDRYAAEEQRRQFSANISHELKTPLQTIIGASELLQNHMVKPQDQEHFLSQIHGESERLLHLIDDIIRLSQLDEGGAMEWETVSLSSILHEVLHALSASAEKAKVAIHYDESDASFEGVPGLVYEIAYNLVDNAIRYNQHPGEVTVTVREEDSKVFLNVQDTGIGIEESEQARIFERFYRVDKSRSRASGGTGLGLSIVKHATQVHHAQVHVDSKLGQGTLMQVCFPKHRAEK